MTDTTLGNNMEEDNSFKGTMKPTAYEYEYILDGELEERSQAQEMVTVMRECTESDTVILRINTNGGCVATCAAILDGIDKCAGTVIGYAEGNVYSAGALIFSACDGWGVSVGAGFNFHEGGMGDMGKPSDVDAYVTYHRKRLKILLDHYCSKFLSTSEIKKICNGKEFYLTSQEMIERIKKHAEECRHDEEREMETGDGSVEAEESS